MKTREEADSATTRAQPAPRARAKVPAPRQCVLLGVALACVIEALRPSEIAVADVTGLWLVFLAPTAIWYGCATRAVATKEAAVLVALGFTLISDMLLLLGLNELLPLAIGDHHPLSRLSITTVLAAGDIVIGAVVPVADPESMPKWRPPRRELRWFALPAAVCLLLSIAGPVRLNNGYGATVAISAYVCITVLLTVVLARGTLSVGTTELVLYCAAICVLLLCSLRGWSITGHDIQKEYHFFEVALGGQYWDVRSYPDPFNACLSITLLPVAVAKLTAIPGVYIFKLVIPALFAAAPVMIFRAVRNVAGHRVAVLSAMFFVMFPTFINDMTYMGRQEVAFVILGAAMLIVTDGARRLRNRRIAFLTLAVGLVFAHYSTTYVVVIVMTGAVLADLLLRAVGRVRSRRKARRTETAGRLDPARSVLVWWMVPIVAALAVAWAGPATQTGGQLKSTLSIALSELSGDTSGQSGSSGSSYSIFGGASESDRQRLAQYAEDSAAQSAAARAKGRLIPDSVLDKYTEPYAAQPVLHLTSIGEELQSHGIPVARANTLARTFAADLLQVLIVLGLLATLLRRRKGFAPTREQVALSIGALLMLGVITLIPQLSVDYSTLRAFQQGIFFFAPFMAIGLIWALSWLRRWTIPAVVLVSTALVLDLSGVVPRITGGYAAQLPLANSGEYYEIYYPTTEEQVAASWLEAQIAASGPKAQKVQIQTDRYTYYRLQDILTSGNVVSNLYPSLLGTNEYTLIGAQTVNDGQATIFYDGDLVNYEYPVGLLGKAYNEIYASNGVEIFQ